MPLRNILVAFLQRCPSLGYCQGWSFIAARLLDVMQEEEAFWTFTQIMEVMLPLDYFSNLQGIQTDMKVVMHLMGKQMPKLVEHLTKHNFDIELSLTKWLICLFT